MGFGGGDLGEDLGGKLWRGQQGAQRLFFRFPRPPLLLCAEGLIMFVR